MTRVTDPCEDAMCTLVPPFSELTDPTMSHQRKKKKGTLQQIQTEDQARFKKFKLQFVKETKCWNSFDEQNTINSETSGKKKKSDK